VFYAKQNGRGSDSDSFVVRARVIGANAAQTAATAAQGVGSAAQTAGVAVNKGVRRGVYVVRVWAAPRLETAAGYTTTTVAPKVSSALLVTARQVRPEDIGKKRGRSLLTWSILGAAVLAAAGAVAAVVRYRYRVVAAETDEDFADRPVGSEPTGQAADSSQAEAERAASTDAGVNGRVSASGW